MVREREFSLSLNVPHLHGYITRRYRAGGTGKSDSGGKATLGKITSSEISAEVASSTFRARQPEIVEYAPPPFPTPAKWPGGVVLEVLRRRKSVRADDTTCAEGPPS